MIAPVCATVAAESAFFARVKAFCEAIAAAKIAFVACIAALTLFTTENPAYAATAPRIAGLSVFNMEIVPATIEIKAFMIGAVDSIIFPIAKNAALTILFRLSMFSAISLPVASFDSLFIESSIFAIPLAKAFRKFDRDVAIPKLFSFANFAIIPVPVPISINLSLNSSMVMVPSFKALYKSCIALLPVYPNDSAIFMSPMFIVSWRVFQSSISNLPFWRAWIYCSAPRFAS